MATAKDPFAEFKGKQTLTEREVKLLLKRMNEGKINPSQLRDNGYALTPDQVEKGRAWLTNLWITPRGVERKNNPYGYRETSILRSFKTIRLADVVDTSFYRATRRFYVPVYEVVGKDDSFMYYLSGGKINIVG
jgi:hypothetical protein